MSTKCFTKLWIENALFASIYMHTVFTVIHVNYKTINPS